MMPSLARVLADVHDGYYCHCRDGFKPDPSNPFDCVDIDECAGNNTCTQLCLNTKGSYLCRCHEDYENNVVVGAMTGKDCRAKVSHFCISRLHNEKCSTVITAMTVWTQNSPLLSEIVLLYCFTVRAVRQCRSTCSIDDAFEITDKQRGKKFTDLSF